MKKGGLFGINLGLKDGLKNKDYKLKYDEIEKKIVTLKEELAKLKTDNVGIVKQIEDKEEEIKTMENKKKETNKNANAWFYHKGGKSRKSNKSNKRRTAKKN